VQEEGIHLRKLKYLRVEEFKILSDLKFKFIKRARDFFRKRGKSGFVDKNKAVGCAVRRDNRESNDKIYPCYEPTRIEYARDSLFWSWRRVKEYFRELKGMNDKKLLKEVYSLMRG